MGDTSLLILAAGLGSRFGGDKQLVAVGPDGEAFLDYAIRDGLQAGVERIVVVTRTGLEAPLRAHLAVQHPGDYRCSSSIRTPSGRPGENRGGPATQC